MRRGGTRAGKGGAAFEDAALKLPEGAIVRKIAVSAATGMNVRELRESVAAAAGHAKPARRLIADLVNPGDVVVLVIPIDSSAPKGRIILPQQMVLRDLLDAHAAALACQPDELAGLLGSLARPPKLVVTDSQAFSQVAAIVPPEVPLTSFSILMARLDGCGCRFGGCGFGFGVGVLASHFGDLRVRGAGCAYLGVQ